MAVPLTVRIEGDDQSQAAFRSALGNIGHMHGGAKGLLGAFRDLTVAAFGFIGAVRQVGRAFIAIFDQAHEAAVAETRLAAALRKAGMEVEENVRQLSRFADQRAAITEFTDKATLNVAALGVQLLKLSGEDLRAAIIAVQDYAATVDIDLSSAMRLLARAIQGGSTELSRFGVTLDKNASQIDQVRSATRQMTTGLAEQIGKLPTGAILRLKKAWDELLETLGKVAAAVLVPEGPSPQEAAKWRAIHETIEQINMAMGAVAAARREAFRLGRIEAGVLPGITTAAEVQKAMQEVQRLLRLQTELELRLERLRSGKLSVLPPITVEAIPFEGPTILGQLQDRGRDMMLALAKGWHAAGEQFAEQVREQAIFLGQTYTDALSQTAIEAFDRDVGIDEALKNLGDRARVNFIGQFSDAMLSPIKESFGRLTQAIIEGFSPVRDLLAGILTPIVNVVAAVVKAVITKILSLLGIQALVNALGIKQMGATQVAVASLAKGWGAAAVAASIATLGGALSSVPFALGAITAGGFLTAGLNFGGGMQEGGLVRGQPGTQGVLAVLGERETEVVLPLSKLDRMFGGGRRAVTINITGGDFADETAKDRLARRIADRMASDSRRLSRGGRRRL